MRFLVALVPAVLALAAAMPASAQQALPTVQDGTITIDGIGEITAAPDTALINSGVTSQAPTAREALDANSDVDMVDMLSGSDDLKARLEILLGAKPEALPDKTEEKKVDESLVANEHRERVAAGLQLQRHSGQLRARLQLERSRRRLRHLARLEPRPEPEHGSGRVRVDDRCRVLLRRRFGSCLPVRQLRRSG